MRKIRSREPDQYRTLRATVTFRVAESEKGPPWISFDSVSGDELDVFKHTMGFTLRPGTTLEEARQIVRFLRRNLGQISETRRIPRKKSLGSKDLH